MRTTGHKRREHVAFAAVLMLIAGVCMTVITSCGGGSDGSSDGELCQQCGDTDGPCLPFEQVSGDDRPDFCGDRDPCLVGLSCVRKRDSAQRRCFPFDPATNALDTSYSCDGSRPNPSFAPTTTTTPLPTVTDTTIPTSPTPEETPAGEDVNVDISIDVEDTFTSSFTVTVTYPAATGSFKNGSATDCEPDEGLVAQDDGNGTLTLTFAGNPEDDFPLGASCVFHQNAGQTLTNADLATSSTSPLLTVETDVL